MNHTFGTILDPFSIFVSGLIRKAGFHQVRKLDCNLDFLHGEAQFKQAFVNACHFAETMTVIGPIARLDACYNHDEVMFPDLQWGINGLASGNTEFERLVSDRVLDKNKLTQNTPMAPSWWSTQGGNLVLPLMADIFLSDRWTKQGQDYRLMTQVFAQNFNCQPTSVTNDGYREAFRRGMPVAALVAVVFTYKKPYGKLAVSELTNLGEWPPTAFLLPVLIPAGAQLFDNHSGNLDVVHKQPCVARYRLQLSQGKPIPAFGQPYNLTSVSRKGKDPDILRSLSDVFRALWSNATQYSAWSADLGDTQGLNLDPIGAGRRIRGHNRYAGRFEFNRVGYLAENEYGNFAYGGEFLTSDQDVTLYRHPREWQLRDPRREMIFVAPSYFPKDTAAYSLHAMLLLNEFTAFSRLSNFVDDTKIHNNDSTVVFYKSLGRYLAEKLGVNTDHDGSIPVLPMRVDLEFNKEGNPVVFGMNVPTSVAQDNTGSAPGGDRLMSTEAVADRLLDKCSVATGFRFKDAFGAKSTKDLTQEFSPVKKPRGKKAEEALYDVDQFKFFDDEEMF